jgi:hypothetical protein
MISNGWSNLNTALHSMHWMGRGEKESADAAACDAIKGMFDLETKTSICIVSITNSPSEEILFLQNNNCNS